MLVVNLVEGDLSSGLYTGSWRGAFCFYPRKSKCRGRIISWDLFCGRGYVM